MSLIEPILPSLRAGLSQSTRQIARKKSIPSAAISLYTPSSAFKRKLTPILPPTVTPLRTFTQSSKVLQYEPPPTSEDEKPASLREKLTRALSSVMPKGTKEQYWAYKKTEELYKECRLQGEYHPDQLITGKGKFWYEECGLVPCLRTWCSISNLHVWMLMVRIRHLEPRARAKMWQQNLINHYYFDIEELLTKRHMVSSNSRRQKTMKELYEGFRYMILTFDEALIRGDAWMAQAVWRCLYVSKEDMDMQKLAIITSYIRRILSGLEKLDEETILSAQVFFGNPMDELPVVERFSEILPPPTTNGKKSR
ncbi:hypothetical protein H072_7971 [Dactylellina haptotyla CBS 200.50]|uniref:Ubiquinol-cytochrome c chaperone domain-containing protein n=1 Tax=Dactylellina haptotyla (strain CBS 200.50) TaxID=1284197 RepID=S8A5Z0_DACHA|nr:hypothetical protein H072_7971 [Dactylellina haptotyla CBS 200.50]